jgi:heptosyltransferase-2
LGDAAACSALAGAADGGAAPAPGPRPLPAGARLLVAQTSFLGDVVLTTPLLSALRRVLRPRHLAVVVRPEAAPLLEHHPAVDAVLVDDKRGRDGGLGGVVRAAARVRAGGYTLAVAPHRSLRTALVLALAGVPRRVGFRESRGAFLYHARVARDPTRHEVERTMGLLHAFGIVAETHLEPPRLVPGPVAERRAEELLATCRAGGRPALYGLCPGSVWATKRWSPDGYATLLTALRARGDAEVLILGGADDAEVAATIHGRAGGAGINLAGRTDLQTFVALLARLRAVVTNDSAPMHMAAAVGVPVVALFCATTPAFGFGPYTARAAVVEADLACRPCARHGGRRCPRGTEDCMRLVRASEVLTALRGLVPDASGTGGA